MNKRKTEPAKRKETGALGCSYHFHHLILSKKAESST